MGPVLAYLQAPLAAEEWQENTGVQHADHLDILRINARRRTPDEPFAEGLEEELYKGSIREPWTPSGTSHGVGEIQIQAK